MVVAVAKKWMENDDMPLLAAFNKTVFFEEQLNNATNLKFLHSLFAGCPR